MTNQEYKKEIKNALTELMAKYGYKKIRKRYYDRYTKWTEEYYVKNFAPNFNHIVDFHFEQYYYPLSYIVIPTFYLDFVPNRELIKKMSCNAMWITACEHYMATFLLCDILKKSYMDSRFLIKEDKSMQGNMDMIEKVLVEKVFPLLNRFSDVDYICKNICKGIKKTLAFETYDRFFTDMHENIPAFFYYLGEHKRALDFSDKYLNALKKRDSSSIAYMEYADFNANLHKLIDAEGNVSEERSIKMTDMLLAMWLKMREMWRKLR